MEPNTNPLRTEPDTPRLEGFERLRRRRSVLARNLLEPGPDARTLADILEVAVRVPDHGKIHPWRFVVFDGENRRSFGELLALRFRERYADAGAELITAEQRRFTRAPVVIAVISSPQPSHKVPVWEQLLSAGAVCQNLLNGATLAGFGAQWLTEWYAYDDVVLRHLGVAEPERVAGFVYIGSYAEVPGERPRVRADEVTARWQKPTP